MTKTTTNYRTLGVAAIVAILAVSVVAIALAPSAIAAPANKVSWMNDDEAITYSWSATGGNVGVAEVTLQEFTLKSSDKGDWLIDMAAECSTFTTIEAKGKKNNEFSGSTAGAKVTLYVDGVENKSWNLCQQDFQTKAYLNDVIVKDEEGTLKFNCDTDPPLDPDAPCEQFIQLYLLNAGSYNAKWVAANLSAGMDHIITIKAVMNAEASQLTDDVPDEPSGINAGVIIGRSVVIAEPIHVAIGDL